MKLEVSEALMKELTRRNIPASMEAGSLQISAEHGRFVLGDESSMFGGALVGLDNNPLFTFESSIPDACEDIDRLATFIEGLLEEATCACER